MKYVYQTFDDCMRSTWYFKARDNYKLLENGKLKEYNIYGINRFFWVEDNVLHRLDGPANIYASGRREWWFVGEHVRSVKNQKQFEQWVTDKLREV